MGIARSAGELAEGQLAKLCTVWGQWAVFALGACLSSSAARAQSVVVFVGGAADTADAAAALAGMPAAVFLRDSVGFRAAALSADIVMVDSSSHLIDANVRIALTDAVNAGQLVLVQYFDLHNEPALQATLGVDAYPYAQFYPGQYGPITHLAAGVPYNVFPSSAGALWGAPSTFSNNGHYLVGGVGADVLATGVQGDATLVATHGGRVAVFGWTSGPFAGLDVYRDGVADGVAAQAAQLRAMWGAVTAPRLPVLEVGGRCPAAVTLHLVGVAPGADLVVVSAARLGTARVPAGPCRGAALGLEASSLRQLARSNADAAGQLSVSIRVGGCGRFYRVVELGACAMSTIGVK